MASGPSCPGESVSIAAGAPPAASVDGVPAGVHGGDEGAAPYVFFRVDDLEAAVAAVERLGGSVDTIPGAEDEASVAVFGEFRMCHDDQGSPFGLHRPPRH